MDAADLVVCVGNRCGNFLYSQCLCVMYFDSKKALQNLNKA